MRRILLVEDNDLNRDMLSRRLVRLGYEVAVAADGAEGVKQAQSLLPDLVLMDMSLPVMDGWEATRQIKSAVETAAIPVIGLSAHALSEDAERALQAGCDDYDTKPIDFNRLADKISRLVKDNLQ
ncbi:MAG: response regulator [Gammaproteobacteria bacterium]|nr:response regulator [Gammaproteobacteria bacterium]